MDTPSELRDCACGMCTTEAAVELPSAGSVAGSPPPVSSGCTYRGPTGRLWVNFETSPDLVGALFGGERALLVVAASIAGGSAADLSETLPALSREQVAPAPG